MSDRENHGPEQPPANEEVGHRKPPMRRRFKLSGKPKGRPRGAKNRRTIVKMVANEMHNVTEIGERRRRSTLDVVLLLLRNKALDKNVRAFEELHRLTKVYQPQEAGVRRGYLVLSAEVTQEEWLAEMERKNEAMERHGVQNLGALAEIERKERRKKKFE